MHEGRHRTRLLTANDIENDDEDDWWEKRCFPYPSKTFPILRNFS
jgi:hypothetical protein